MDYSIETVNLWRIYKSKDRYVEALRDVNLRVRRGELFGVLGPNGAGKTTLIKILSTLLLPSRGEAFVEGYNVATEAKKIRPLINMVSGGEYSGYGLLTVYENLWMFSQFYGIPSKIAKERINRLLEIVGLVDKKNAKIRTLSTGERMKMNIVRGFMTDPKVIFLDEPTLGLDVGTSRTIRGFIKNWIRENPDRTIILTTHYMAEAEELCDRIAIINEGEIITVDTPENLKKKVTNRIVVNIEVAKIQSLKWLKELPELTALDEKENSEKNTLTAKLILREHIVEEIVNKIAEKGGRLIYLKIKEPTLEDVFLELVGRGLNG
ncbi:MAG: ATP-binding cassette domain-containing protein [Candidatus Njordarchaeia archaeon]